MEFGFRLEGMLRERETPDETAKKERLWKKQDSKSG